MTFINWRTTADPRDAIHRAVQVLCEQGIVIFPTETAYVALADSRHTDGVRRLAELATATGTASQANLRLVPSHGSQIFDWSTDLTAATSRLLSRVVPGPISLRFTVNTQANAWIDLPLSTREAILEPTGHVTARLPLHEAIEQTMVLLKRPGALVDLALPDGTLAYDATSAAVLAPDAALVIDDGPARHTLPPTALEATSVGWRVRGLGVVGEQRLRPLAGQVLVFVCTGNTCRSPMAEALMKRALSQRWDTAVDALSTRGFTILSAGLAASPSSPASPNAAAVMQEFGANLDDHLAQGLSESLARFSDRLLVMTKEHRNAIVTKWPRVAGKVSLLDGDIDVVDPFGGSLEEYRRCATQIDRAVQRLVDELGPPDVGLAVEESLTSDRD